MFSKTQIFLILAGLFIWLNSCQTGSVSGTQHLQLGDRYNNTNDYKNAIYHYQEYLKMAPSLGLYRNPQREAEVCRKLAHAYSTQGNYQKSLTYLDQALAIDTTLSDNRLNIIKDYENIGKTHAYMGDLQEARKYLQTALQKSEGLENSIKEINQRYLADTYLSIAQIDFTAGEYFKSEEEALEALLVYENIKDEFGIMEATLLLGSVYIIRDELDHGINLVKRSVQLAEKNDFSLSRQYQVLGDALVSSGELEEGLRIKLAATDEAERSNILPQIVWSYIKVGDTYELIGNDQEAVDYYRKAGELQEKIRDDTSAFNPSLELRLGDVQKAYDRYLAGDSRIGMGLARLKMAEIHLGDKDLNGAETDIKEAIEIFQGVESNEGQANAFLLLSRIYRERNVNDSSIYYASQAEQLTQRPETLWKIYYSKGLTYNTTNDHDQALDYYEKAIRIIEGLRGNFTLGQLKTAFFSNRMEVYDHIIQELVTKAETLPDQEDKFIRNAYYYTEKARARNFLDMLGNRHLQPKNEADSALLKKEQLYRIQLGKHASGAPGNADTEDNINIDDLNAEYSDLATELFQQNQDYSSVISVEPPSLEDIEKQIDDETVLLSYWVSDDQTFIWAITSDNFQLRSVDISGKDIERKISQVRTMVKFRVADELQSVLSDLYSLLISPVEEVIKDYSKICIIPHRSLHFLPFHALISGHQNYLIEDHIVYYAPSASVYYYSRIKQRPESINMLGMAIGEKNIEGFAPLPGTVNEVNHISQLYESDEILIGNASTETYFKEQSKYFSIIHLATHGVLNPDQPFQSYALLSPDEKNDGLLKIDEIFSINLNSRLVVISACETGLGQLDKGDELIGLSRSLMYSGTPSVIASLWTVNDLSTSIFMVKLHQYLQNGWDLAESVSFAQRDMISMNYTSSTVRGERSERNVTWDDRLIEQMDQMDHNEKKHPYFWAPFVLIGDGLATNLNW